MNQMGGTHSAEKLIFEKIKSATPGAASTKVVPAFGATFSDRFDEESTALVVASGSIQSKLIRLAFPFNHLGLPA
jgi:hypothetical protein